MKRYILKELRAYVREVIVEIFEDMKRSNAAWTVTDHSKYSGVSGDRSAQAWIKDVLVEIRNTYSYLSKKADEKLLNFLKDNVATLNDQKTMNKAKFLHKESLEEMIEEGIIKTILGTAKSRLTKKKQRNNDEEQFLKNFDFYVDFWRMLTPTMLALDFEDTKLRIDRHLDRVKSLASRIPQGASRGR